MSDDELTLDLIDKAIEKARNITPAVPPAALRLAGSNDEFKDYYMIFPRPEAVQAGLEQGWLKLVQVENVEGRVYTLLDIVPENLPKAEE